MIVFIYIWRPFSKIDVIEIFKCVMKKSVLLFFLGLGLFSPYLVSAQEICGEGWNWRAADSTLTIEKDYNGVDFDGVSEYEVKRLVFDEGVTSTESFGLLQQVKLQSISFSSTITCIKFCYDEGSGALLKADTVYAHMEEPVPIAEMSFNKNISCDSHYEPLEIGGTPVLIVPEGRVEAYADSDWGDYFAYIGDKKGEYGWPLISKYWEYYYRGVLFIRKDYRWGHMNLHYPQKGISPEFWGGINLEVVTIEEGTVEIGDYAFAQAFPEEGLPNNLTTIRLPQSLKTIGGGAFMRVRCPKIDLPDGLDKIGDSAFAGSLIESIRIPNGVKYIDRFTFYHCDSLRYVELPRGLETIGQQAFFEDGLLSSIYFPENLRYIGWYAFEGCANICEPTGLLILPQNLIEVGRNAFCGCLSIRRVVMPSSLVAVGEYSFADEQRWPHNYYIKDQKIRVDCYAYEPPKSDGNILGNEGVKGDLYVPAESVERYKASNWAKEFNIYPLDPDEENPYTALEDVKGVKLEVSVVGGVVSVEGVDEFDVYDVSGCKLPAGRPLPAGVYVVSTPVGSERVVVK